MYQCVCLRAEVHYKQNPVMTNLWENDQTLCYIVVLLINKYFAINIKQYIYCTIRHLLLVSS